MSWYWLYIIGFVIVGAMLLLALLGLVLAAVMPGVERWSKRFFMCFFAVLALCMCACFADMIAYGDPALSLTMSVASYLESLAPSILIFMLTVYLVHCRGENCRKSILLRVEFVLWFVYFILLGVAQCTSSFFYYSSDNQLFLGPWYPLLMAPLLASLVICLTAVIHWRGKLSNRRFQALLVALIPLAVAVTVHLLEPSFLLVYTGVIISSIAMFVIVVLEQVEQYLVLQRETVRQHAKILVLRMRPHFIHNTMTSIYYLCDQDPQTAKRVTMDFNTYLRKNFNAIAKDEAIPFTEELEHTRAYLAVEQAQFESKLVVDYDTPHTLFHVPPLTLQPLAENAVKHGMSPDTVPLRICIRTRKTDFGSEVVVEDNGPGFDSSAADGLYTTLSSIRQRLAMMCEGRLDIESRESGGTAVKVTIPDRTSHGSSST